MFPRLTSSRKNPAKLRGTGSPSRTDSSSSFRGSARSDAATGLTSTGLQDSGEDSGRRLKGSFYILVRDVVVRTEAHDPVSAGSSEHTLAGERFE